MVKKIAIGSLLILGLVLGGASWVKAQAPFPPSSPMYDHSGHWSHPSWGTFHRGRMGFAPQVRPPLVGVEETLGMSEDALREALVSGQTLAQIAEAQGITLDDLTAALAAEAQEHLQQAVTDGYLTQAQADERLAQIKATTKQRLEAGGWIEGATARPWHHPMSHRGMQGGYHSPGCECECWTH